MARFLKFPFIVLLLLVTACSGTGTKYSSNFPQIVDENASDRRIYVMRDTGFIGNARLFEVALNSQVIGNLGDKEVISANAQPGDNYLSASMGGLNLGLESTQIRFKSDAPENQYFVLGLRPGFWTNKLVWNKTDLDSFRYRATQ